MAPPAAADRHLSGRSDDELMLWFAAGDSDASAAFDILYNRYKDRTWRYFVRQTGAERARDCQQDLWMKIIERRHNYRAEGRFDAYLFSVAHSTFMDRLRKSMRTVDGDSGALDDLTAPPQTAEPARVTAMDRTLARLAGAIAGLPLAQRSAFIMREEAGLSLADIATATATTIETVKSRLRYARNRLREELTDVDL